MRVDVTSEIVIHRPRSVVADYLFDPTNLAQWRADVESVRRAAAGPVVVDARYLIRVRGRLRDSERVDAIASLDPLVAMTLRTVAGDAPLETTYRLAAEHRNSTLVSVRTTGGDPGTLGAVTVPLMSRSLRRTVSADLTRLKTILEVARDAG